MAEDESEIALSRQDLREVTAFAAACAEVVLEVFEADQPDDSRPRDAIGAAWEFARGGKRGKSLRDTAWASLKAAKSADTTAAREAAWAAMSAAPDGMMLGPSACGDRDTARGRETHGFHVAVIDAPGHGDRPRTGRDEQEISELREAQAAGEPEGPIVVRHR